MRLLRNMEKRDITPHIRRLVNDLIQILITNDENIPNLNMGQETNHHFKIKREGIGRTVHSMKALDLKRTSPTPILREEEPRTTVRTIQSPHNIHRRISPDRFLKKPQGDSILSKFSN